MGENNRERRAAKQRKQHRDDRRPRTAPDAAGDLVQLLSSAGLAAANGDVHAAEECAVAVLTSPAWGVPSVLQAVVAVVVDGLLHCWRRGWQPVDLHQVTRRTLAREHVGVLAHLLAEAMRPYAVATVDARWQDQLDELGAVVSWPPDANALLVWQLGVRGPGKGPGDLVGAVTTALELFALLASLGRIAPLMAIPGAARPQDVHRQPVDQKMLARVRALLAKAESTEFDDEAEALSAKAQELMTRYSLERLVVEGDHVEPATARRIWLDAPYAGAKALLVSAVAKANRCTGVWNDQLGMMTVLGDEPDLAGTEVVVTSLLVQATRAMLHGAQRGADRQRSFRQSFLVAYGTRIGERLASANEHVTDDVAHASGAQLVPVLKAQSERVESAREQLFPRTTSHKVSVSNGYGYAAGRAAADLAVLPTGQQLAT